jgi:hypothetical protein
MGSGDFWTLSNIWNAKKTLKKTTFRKLYLLPSVGEGARDIFCWARQKVISESNFKFTWSVLLLYESWMTDEYGIFWGTRIRRGKRNHSVKTCLSAILFAKDPTRLNLGSNHTSYDTTSKEGN